LVVLSKILSFVIAESYVEITLRVEIVAAMFFMMNHPLSDLRISMSTQENLAGFLAIALLPIV